MWRDVLRPCTLRPPGLPFLASSDFSGVDFVTSAKSEEVWNRRPALVGLRERIAMASSVLEQRDLTRGQRHDRPLRVGLVAHPVATARTRHLALAVERVDLQHLDAPDRLDRIADLRLAGARVHLERVDAGLHQLVALLGDDRRQDDVAGVFHCWIAPSSEADASSSRRSASSLALSFSMAGSSSAALPPRAASASSL